MTIWDINYPSHKSLMLPYLIIILSKEILRTGMLSLSSVKKFLKSQSQSTRSVSSCERFISKYRLKCWNIWQMIDFLSVPNVYQSTQIIHTRLGFVSYSIFINLKPYKHLTIIYFSLESIFRLKTFSWTGVHIQFCLNIFFNE